jgi:phosphatidylglycerol---prolipoprotein diacylglyceryl transferase
LALYGGLILAVAVSVALLPLASVRFWTFWDAASLTMLVGLFFTRFGCLVNGCCGGVATSRWFGVNLPDDKGRWGRRISTQLLEAGWALLALGVALEIAGQLPFKGFLFVMVLGGYGAVRLLLEPTRAYAAGRRANVAASAALLVASVSYLVWWTA